MGYTALPIVPVIQRYPITYHERCAYVAVSIQHLSDEDFLKGRGTDRYSHFVGSPAGEDWRRIWQHEFDRRFLLRPAVGPGDADPARLLRAA